jgi:IS30 family transposase
MARLTREDRMAIKALARRGSSNREVARQLGVTEGTVRYHLRREAEGAVDGRSRRNRLFQAVLSSPL